MHSSDNWDTIVNTLGPSLFRYFRTTLSEPTAEDCVQETFVRLWRKLQEGHFDPQKGSLRMYAYGIAGFVRKEARKERSAAVLDRGNDEAPSLEDNLAYGREVAQLRQALAQLSEIQQQVLSLYLDDELTLDEMAKLLGQPLGTIKSHIHRAKEDLKKKLNPSTGAL